MDTEDCDDGGTNGCGPCNSTCTGPGTGSTCGDAIWCPDSEDCDDGGTDDCGSCNSTCTGPGTGSICGDGIRCIEAEICDDGYTDECGSCNSTCVAAGYGAVCGDGLVCPETEQCDGNNLNGLHCGDFGYVNPVGLACEPGCSGFDTTGCIATCGNSVCEPPENTLNCAQDC